MRIARVLHESTPRPIVALERDGALYDVAELDRIFGTRHAPGKIADPSDYHARVISLACAGLDELDDRLLAGDRPTEARLFPQTFLWLAPCSTDRAMYIQVGEPAASAHEPGACAPCYFIGNARGLLGHDASVPFPPREEEPDCELCVAALLRDDLYRATPDEAERAILGYAILGGWTAREEERRRRASGCGVTRARDFAPQLGPVLVTKNEVGEVGLLRAQVRAGGEVTRCGSVGEQASSLAEAIAYVSAHIELRAGDVIGSAPIPIKGGSLAEQGPRLSYGSPVDLIIERLGKLTGRPVRGPEPVVWRRSSEPRRPRAA